METENQVNLDTETQDVDGANNENNASATESDESKKAFEDQKKRAEKAEAELKRLKALVNESAEEEKVVQPAQSANQEIDKDELVLYAKDFQDEEVAYAKKVAALEGISLREAAQHDLFLGWKKKQDSEKQAKGAQLNASRGSGANPKSKGLDTPGLSQDEHKALWKKSIGK